jgi:hypothetical protein
MTNEPETITVRLFAGLNSAGSPVLEQVPATPTGDGRVRLSASPGLAQGAAAGDEVVLKADGQFDVIERGGNLCVQVLGEREFAEAQLRPLVLRVESLGGWLDGGGPRLRVFTVPVSAGFPSVEAVFKEFVSDVPGSEWYFGNVYDPHDGVTPLHWWED